MRSSIGTFATVGLAATLLALLLLPTRRDGAPRALELPAPARATPDAALAELELARDHEVPRAASTADAAAAGAADARERPCGPCDGLWVHVVDADGTSQAGVELVVFQRLRRTRGAAAPDHEFEDHVRTGADGRARISAPSADEIQSIELRRRDAPVFVCGGDLTTSPGAPDEVRVALPRAARVHGHARDATGAPLANVRLALHVVEVAARVLGEHTFRWEDERRSFTTDVAGAFAIDLVTGWYGLELTELPAGPESVVFELDAERREREVDFVVPAFDRRVRIALDAEPGAGDPFTRLRIVAERRTSELESTREAGGIVRTRERRSVPAERAEGGVWNVVLDRTSAWTLHAEGPRVVAADADVPEGASEVQLVLRRAPVPEVLPRFAGKVVDARGVLLAGAEVVLVAGNTRYVGNGPRDGTFSIPLRPRSRERVDLLASLPGFATVGAGPFQATEARSDLVVVLPPGLWIHGRVQGLPEDVCADVTSSPCARDRALAPAAVSPRSQRVRTDGHGSFAFADLAAGDYALWITPQDHALPPARAVVRAGERCVVALGEGLEGELAIDCTVVDALTRAPIPDAEVWLAGATEQPRGAGGRTGADGRCRLRGHVAGTWSPSATATGYARAEMRAEEFTQSCARVIELAPACTLDLAIADAAGPRVVEVAVATLDGGRVDVGGWPVTDVSGRITLRGVPAGRVRVFVGPNEGGRGAFDGSADELTLANPRGLPVFELEARPGVRTIVPLVLR